MQQSHKPLFKVSLLLPFLLAGCGNYQTTLPNDYNYVPNIAPHLNGTDTLQAPLRHKPYAADTEAIERERDPYMTQQNPMLGKGIDKSDPMVAQGNSRLLASADASDPKQRPTYGRYYLDGDVTSGQVDIAVNGTPIGTFSSHVDQEVTDYCHNGTNYVTFTHHPGIGSAPMSAVHIELLNQEKPSDPLAFTYDTTTEAEQTTESPDPPTVDSSTPGIPKPAIPSAGSPSLAAGHNSHPDGATDTREFSDGPESYQPPPQSN